jgi:hypothetical protein
LSSLNLSKKRVRIFYGDTQTAKNWNDEYDTIGTIGKSNGQIKIPLLIKTKRSFGGSAILDQRILKIVDIATNKVLYQCDNYKPDNFFCLYKNTNSNEAVVYMNDINNVYANCHTIEKALKLCNFMNGLKHSKN